MRDSFDKSFYRIMVLATSTAFLVILSLETLDHILFSNFGWQTHDWFNLLEGALLAFLPTAVIFTFFSYRWHKEREHTLHNLTKLNQKLRELSVTDGLTGVSNHRYFQMTLEREWQRMLRHGHRLTCVMVDIDNFKKFNDEHGHQAGDAVLRAVGQVLKNEFREIDTVTRYGGEEFAVLLAEKPGHVPGLQKMLERIRQRIEEVEVVWHGQRMHVTASLGAAMVPHAEILEPEKLVGAADQALYAAKKAGKNCARIFQEA